MAQAKAGDAVKVHYRGTLSDGREFDSSADREPLGITLGNGEVIPGFEEAVVGMGEGEQKRVTIAADDAYGPHRQEMVQDVARNAIPDSIELEAGLELQAQDRSGRPVVLRVVSFDDEMVRLDANHPLAGEDLIFDIELLEIA